MANLSSARAVAVMLAGVATVFWLTPPVPAAGKKDADTHVRARVAAMVAAQAALDILGDMSGGRRAFDRRLARDARRDLARQLRAIPSLFRSGGVTPRSRARPAIWREWENFTRLSRRAVQTARALDTGRLHRMRQGLTDVVQACLQCHALYRRPP